MEHKVDYKWFLTIILLGFCIYLQYKTMDKVSVNEQSNQDVMSAIIKNQGKIQSLKQSIDSLEDIKTSINNDIHKNYNDYETNITNAYYSSDSIKFKYLSKDIDSMERLWNKGYYIRH